MVDKESEKGGEKRFDSLYAPLNPSIWQTRLSVVDRFQHGEGTKDDEHYFFHKYRSLVIAIGKKNNLSNDDIKDLVGCVFPAVFEEFAKISAGKKTEIKIDRLDRDRKSRYHFKFWLARIIRNKIYDIYRERGHLNKVDSIAYRMFLKAPSEQDEPDRDFNELWHKHLLREALLELKENLPATHFRVFYLVKMKGRKGPQVAEAFRLSPDNVNQICSRNMKELRRIIASLEEENPQEKYADDELCRYIDVVDKEFQELEDEFPEA